MVVELAILRPFLFKKQNQFIYIFPKKYVFYTYCFDEKEFLIGINYRHIILLINKEEVGL